MIKRALIILFGLFVFACNNSASKSETSSQDKPEITADDKEPTLKQRDGLTLLKGDFLYLTDAAVLQTHREIYGVVIDEKMHELNAMVQKYKNEDTDMVPVEIRGKIFEKPEGEEGWPMRVEIKEILSVSAPNPNKDDVIKITE